MFSVVICRGTCFHPGSQCSIWPASRVSNCGEFSSGASDSMRCMLSSANLTLWHARRVLLEYYANIQHKQSNYSGPPDKQSNCPGAPENILNHNAGIVYLKTIFTIEVISPDPFKTCLKLHSWQLCATSSNIFPVILLHLIIYLLLIHSLPHLRTNCLHYSKWNLHPARCQGIAIHRPIIKYTMREHYNSTKHLIIIVLQMFAFQSSGFMHRIAND